MDIAKRKIKKCRVCSNKNLIRCIDIGNQYLSSIFPENLNYKKTAKKYPLSLVICKKDKATCGTLQLEHFINLDSMYENYPYLSSTNSSMKLILKDVVDGALKRIKVLKDDIILDIGGNDGTLLSYLIETKAQLLTIDPAKNIRPVFTSARYRYINNYFNKSSYDKATNKKAKLIFSIAMFYHLSNPVEFSADVRDCMDDEGIWIIQMAYLPSMIRTNMYDNIVHEHAGYYTLHNMQWIMEKVGLKIFDCELNDVYGGSFRVFIKKKENNKLKINSRVRKILKEEEGLRVNSIATYHKFMKNIEKTKRDLIKLLQDIKTKSKSVWVYGASTKGNTILQYCNITTNFIEAAADSNEYKRNKIMIGSDIPIYDEDSMRQRKPDYLLSLPYSFTQAFIKREEDLVQRGTKFIVPLPNVKILP